MKTSIRFESGHPVLDIDEQLLRDAGFDESEELEVTVQSGRMIIETVQGRETAFAEAREFLFDRYGDTLAKLAE